MEQLRHQEQELMICMMLDNQNHLLNDIVLSKGTVNATLITQEKYIWRHSAIMQSGLILGQIILAAILHQVIVTVRSRRGSFKAGEMLGISLLDHIIIGDHRYVSFRGTGNTRRIPEMKGLFYAFTKNVRNRPGQQHHQSLFLFKEQELHGKKHGGIKGRTIIAIGNEGI